jgi:hypothetical protein
MRSAARSVADSDVPISVASLAKEGPHGPGLESPFPDLGSRRKRRGLCAAPKQIVAAHRLAAAYQTKCSPHMFDMLPG